MTQEFHHLPVMVDAVVEVLAMVPPGLLVDATVGAGGHSRALLDAAPQLALLGIDRDEAALDAAAANLERFGGRVHLRRASFDHLVTAVAALATGPVTAVLFDLGVSSAQVDTAERGFSYRLPGPLDMRMDRSSHLAAADVVNGYSEAALARLFAENGETRFARRLARAIVAERPLWNTMELAAVVSRAIPAPARRRGHPARRVFQAIRIEVNAELEQLREGLDQALELLAPGGRCAVLAYHSGEDRIVKERFDLAATGGCVCPPGLPCVCGAVPAYRLQRRAARRPSAAEVAANPRAEAARLRVVERLELEAA